MLTATWAQVLLVLLTAAVFPAIGHALAVWRDLDRLNQWKDRAERRMDKTEDKHEVQSTIIAGIQATLASILAKLEILVHQADQKDKDNTP